MSEPPPGANGVSRRIGRVGYCACPSASAHGMRRAIVTAASARRFVSIEFMFTGDRTFAGTAGMFCCESRCRESLAAARLFPLDSGGADHFADALGVRADKRAELLRTA